MTLLEELSPAAQNTLPYAFFGIPIGEYEGWKIVFDGVTYEYQPETNPDLIEKFQDGAKFRYSFDHSSKTVTADTNR